ncbi:MAG: hypothetical protein N2517_02085 [Ignavibacteria bacterium]|nr:hypothetical protein [Ignavibacteria bacterium]
MMTQEKISEHDKSNMFGVLRDFPKQVETAIEIGLKAPCFNNNNTRFVILGIGGSAIAGDIVKALLMNYNLMDLEIIVNRNFYPLVPICDATNLIVSTYSGNTEETISSYHLAKRNTKNIIGITSGGQIKQELQGDGFPIISIPSGYQPRCALAFSFFSILLLILRSIRKHEILISEFDKLKSNIKDLATEFSSITEGNRALNFAEKFFNKILVTFACEETLYPIAMRFKAQVQENAKNLAFASPIPEMSHNEINSFEFPSDLLNFLQIIILADDNDFEGNKRKIIALEKILTKNTNVVLLRSEKSSFLIRMFELLYLLDWISFYLAILNETDPTPIPATQFLKKLT